MDGAIQFVLLLLLTSSIILQTCATCFAAYLARLSRFSFSWLVLTLAFLLIAVRQGVTFYHLLTGGVCHTEDPFSEAVSFVISLLLVTGLFSVAPMVRKSMQAPDEALPGDLFEQITSGVAVYEAVDKGRDFIIRDMNPAAERIDKVAREHAIGVRVTEVLPGIKEFGLLDVLQRVWKTGQSENFPLHYYQDKRIAGWRDSFVYRRSGGEVVAVYDDVSAQMRLQEELEHREQKFRMLFEQAPLPYQVLDGEGRILEVNPAWLSLTGLNRSAAAGRLFSELLSREGRQRFSLCLEELKKGGVAENAQLELRRNDGAVLSVEMNALLLRGKTGGAEQIYCMLRETDGYAVAEGVEKKARDLADEQLAGERRELQRHRLSLLGDLAAGMAHEMNAPLAAARNAFNLMRQSKGASDADCEFVEMASLSLSRMSDLVERMYRFHEPVPSEYETLNINALLDNTLTLVRSSMRGRNIRLQDERAKSLPTVVLPPGAVMLALLQPVKNSVEAMPADGVLTLRTGEAEHGGVFVEIEDDGPGIPKEFLPHLFEPFTTFRHGGAQSGGAGLGMAMVQHTLNALGGSVTVRSDIGAGTCVRIVLPSGMRPTC
jgi:PAS domain S-box-containing protein